MAVAASEGLAAGREVGAVSVRKPFKPSREQMRRWKATFRKRHRTTRCGHCSRALNLDGLHQCSRCLALLLERPTCGELRHDTAAHARMLEAARNPLSRCAASGLTLYELAKVGLSLQVDRIDPRRGYERGNMALLAAPLNRAKARGFVVPRYALEALAELMGFRPKYGGWA